jgi:hypothetical protein
MLRSFPAPLPIGPLFPAALPAEKLMVGSMAGTTHWAATGIHSSFSLGRSKREDKYAQRPLRGSMIATQTLGERVAHRRTRNY